jgi:hypothetical protein
MLGKNQAQAQLTCALRFLMKCQNETVTVELKNGRLHFCTGDIHARFAQPLTPFSHSHMGKSRTS